MQAEAVGLTDIAREEEEGEERATEEDGREEKGEVRVANARRRCLALHIAAALGLP
jgi:hypothetical protein